MRLSREQLVDLLRSAGGLLLAVGAIVIVLRKSGDAAWTDLDRLLVLLVPTVVLYLQGIGAFEGAGPAVGRPSQSVLVVASVLLAPVTLLQFLAWAGVDTQQALVDAGVFAAAACLAGYAAWHARVRYAALLAGLYLLIAWLFLWSKVVEGASADTYRWLLVVAAGVLAMLARALWKTRAEAGELVTVAGIAAVAAGVMGVIVGVAAGAVRSISSGFLSVLHGGGHQSSSLHGPTSGLQHFGWDVYLLVVSLALVWVGSRIRVRGPGYVGAFGLLAFVGSVSAQVTRIEAGKAPTSHIVGWPLALVILGALGVLMPLVLRRREA